VSVEMFCLPNLLMELHCKFVYIRDETDLKNSAFFTINVFYTVTHQTLSCF
jgi:hypothetical protein